MDNMKGSGPIPNRWLRCPRKSSDLIINKFIAFKTPLDDKFDSQIPIDCRFPPKMLFDFYRSKKVKIGLWIDLTNTSRFYNSQDIEKFDCIYQKVKCRGHGETPNAEQIEKFINLCHRFITYHPLEVIAVHCTHGFNRTGFLIVSYLVKIMDFDLESALNEFKKVRPPGIYKQDYLRELYDRYYGEPDSAPPAPALPNWCYEEETPDEDVTNSNLQTESTSSDAGNSKQERSDKKHKGKVPKFMEGVPGVKPVLDSDLAHTILKTAQKMCAWKKKEFPGSQPVSMDCQNIHLLHQEPYRVSWKADGTRYMMLIYKKNEVYFLDRDSNVFLVDSIRFPHKEDFHRHLSMTLLDGEMVIDRMGEQMFPRYLAYDIVSFEGKDVGQRPFFPVRLQCIMEEIITPRNNATVEGLIDKTQEPFSIRLKDFWEVTRAVDLLGDKFCKQLLHEPDGLIFQPSIEPYTPGPCEKVLKWKPLDMNSVDFRLKIQITGGMGKVPEKVGCLFVGQLEKPFGQMKYTKALKELDNKIIECKFENGSWVFMRERTDKSFPNSYNTAYAVYHSIREPVTKEMLLNYIDKRRYRGDIDFKQPPPPKKRRIDNNTDTEKR